MIRGPVRESAAVEVPAVTIRPNPPSEILAHPAMVWFPPSYAFIALTPERSASKRTECQGKNAGKCAAPVTDGRATLQRPAKGSRKNYFRFFSKRMSEISGAET